MRFFLPFGAMIERNGLNWVLFEDELFRGMSNAIVGHNNHDIIIITTKCTM